MGLADIAIREYPNESIELSDGRQFELERVTAAEVKLFVKELPRFASYYTRGVATRHPIEQLFDESAEELLVAMRAAKKAISPTPGAFGGMNRLDGLLMQGIRPDYITPTAQGQVFDVPTAPTTAAWRGLYHNAAIGGAYNSTALYLRKELALVIIGLLEQGPYAVSAAQFDIASKVYPVWWMQQQLRSTDFSIFRLPRPLYLPPSKQYRSQAYWEITGVRNTITPIGIAFVQSDFAKNTAPTAPSTTAP